MSIFTPKRSQQKFSAESLFLGAFCPEVQKLKIFIFWVCLRGVSNGYDFWNILIISDHLQKNQLKRYILWNLVALQSLALQSLALKINYFIFIEFWQILPILSEKGQKQRVV